MPLYVIGPARTLLSPTRSGTRSCARREQHRAHALLRAVRERQASGEEPDLARARERIEEASLRLHGGGRARHARAGRGSDGDIAGQVAGQVTYHGHLLYTYSGDSAPGDVKGIGIPDWYPVSPSGAKVDKEDDHGNSGGY